MNNLPADDVWPFIFEYLTINDLFTCRLVNKKFKYFSDNSNHIHKLVIGKLRDSFDSWYESYFKNKLSIDDVISFECYERIKSLSLFNLDRKLKYLRINKNINNNNFKLNSISNLNNLEYLEIIDQSFVTINSRITIANCLLKFNKLKYLMCEGKFYLNTPNLEIIKFNTIKDIHFKSNPELIKHLITKSYINDLKIFKNLEILEFTKINQYLNDNLLIIFEKLNQLKIHNFQHNFSSIKRSNSRTFIKLVNIFNSKINLKREIDIFLFGVKIINLDKINEMKSCKIELEYQIKNSNLLDLNSCFNFNIKYDELEKCFNELDNNLPSFFFDKYTKNSIIELKNIKNLEYFNWFLNNLKCLIDLRILNNSKRSIQLDQNFFNNLSINIKRLTIEKEFDINFNLNYDFIFKLNNLEFFKTIDSNICLFDLASKLLFDSKNLYHFEFRFDGKEIKIIKYDLNDFTLSYNRILNEELNYNKLLELCNKIKSRKNINSFKKAKQYARIIRFSL